MGRSTLFELLETVTHNGVSGCHYQGYHWLVEILLPALGQAPQLFPTETMLIAECYYIVGELYMVNNAPRAALKAYQQATLFDPELAEAYREGAICHFKLGNYPEANRLIEQSLHLEPNNQEFITIGSKIALAEETRTPPFYHPDDPRWQFDDLLATGTHQEARKQLEQLEGLPYYLRAARYSGALSNDGNYLHCWDQIQTIKEPFSLDFADWFYMPATIYRDVTIWEIFKTLYREIQTPDFFTFPGLSDSKKYQALPREEQTLQGIEFQIAYLTGDINRLNKFQSEYPEWVQLQEIIDSICGK